LDDGQVQIKQHVERPLARQSFLKVTGQPLLNGSKQTPAQTRQGHIRIDLVEPDFDVPPPDPPAPRNVILVIRTVKQLVEPATQSAFEPLDPRRAALDDLESVGMALDLFVKIVDEAG